VALQRIVGAQTGASISRNSLCYDGVQDQKPRAARAEPTWVPLSAPAPKVPNFMTDTDDTMGDPYALNSMLANGNQVMACEDLIWDYDIKVSFMDFKSSHNEVNGCYHD
jgi:hypothetical protein